MAVGGEGRSQIDDMKWFGRDVEPAIVISLRHHTAHMQVECCRVCVAVYDRREGLGVVADPDDRAFGKCSLSGFGQGSSRRGGDSPRGCT